MTKVEDPKIIDPGVRIGHVHLKVADLQRSLHFYCDVLGFEITQRYGSQAVFISAGGYHHHIGLNTWESLGGSPPPAGSTGLYHVAICIRPGNPWRPHFDASWLQASLLMEPAITESAKHCTCVTLIRMASSCTGIDRRISGHDHQTVNWQCSLDLWN